VIKTDIMGVFSYFHAHSKFVKSVNASFIALIPKTPGAIDLTDFRPISLVCGVYNDTGGCTTFVVPRGWAPGAV
jgi:hypothetical protein